MTPVRTLAFTLAAALAAMACDAISARALAQMPTELGSHADAMSRLSFMHGTWRGEARMTDQSGKVTVLTQTERVGPMLQGDILVVEGKSYHEDASVAFNALAVISHDPATDAYEMRSYAMGRAGTFALTVRDNGFTWEITSVPGGVVRYAAVIEGDTWRETGEFVPTGSPRGYPFFEMTLTRVGDTDWPAKGALTRD